MADRAHNYDYAVDTTSETAAAKVVRFVGTKKRVLEIGCGPGSITKILHGQNQCTVTGLEVDPEAIRLVTPYCDRVISADLNNADWGALASDLGQFETIVAADVLEHLYDPWTILSNLRLLLITGGDLVVSLPHVGHAGITACLLSGDFEYRDWGLLDRTHIRFFGIKNIDSLFSRAGLKIVKVGFVIKPPEETEFSSVWESLRQELKDAIKAPVHSDVYQVVVKAVPEDAPGDAVTISESISLDQDSAKRPVGLRSRIKTLLSYNQRAFLKR